MAPPSIAKKYLSLEELSALTGLSVSTLRRRVRDGSLPTWQPGGRRTRLLFPLELVDAAMSAVSSDTNSQGDAPPESTNAREATQSSQESAGTPLAGPTPRWMKGLRSRSADQ